jgi:hypothetical protein
VPILPYGFDGHGKYPFSRSSRATDRSEPAVSAGRVSALGTARAPGTARSVNETLEERPVHHGLDTSRPKRLDLAPDPDSDPAEPASRLMGRGTYGRRIESVRP